jgi:Putative addiction module component
MVIEQIEAEILALTTDEQASLLSRLLENLGKTIAIDPAISQVWIDEARDRDRAMDLDPTLAVPAAEVFSRIRSSLKS